jgi:hypothetical protein
MPGTLVALLLLAAPLPVEGTVKGRLVWPAGLMPDNPEVKVGRDAEYMLAKGPIRANHLIVNPKNHGIANAVFYLANPTDLKKPLPLGAAVKKGLAKSVELTMPRGEFLPRIAVVAPGQSLTLKNNSEVAMAPRIDGPGELNRLRLLRPDDRMTLDIAEPYLMPLRVSCPIHPWMSAYVIAAPGPYFAVTDADGTLAIRNVPTGRYRLIGWHEKFGWIFPRPKPGELPGTIIEVKAGKDTDLGKIVRDVTD